MRIISHLLQILYEQIQLTHCEPSRRLLLSSSQYHRCLSQIIQSFGTDDNLEVFNSDFILDPFFTFDTFPEDEGYLFDESGFDLETVVDPVLQLVEHSQTLTLDATQITNSLGMQVV